ncbi:MAG: hypothetical protein RMX96_03735 [Nostoc sp. ChiSLP02]|nr:hypothetical protein [Nostoc sp. ChiSLP02]
MLIVVPMGFLFKDYNYPGYKWFNDFCILGWLWLQQLVKIGYAKKSQG